MTDLVSQLVGALEGTTRELESVLSAINDDRIPHDGDEFHERLQAARAALTAAKAGGWVAVPVEPTVDMLVAAHDAEHCGHHEPHFANAYRAMLAARPTTPPKEQA